MSTAESPRASEAAPSGLALVVMGVSGTGKSAVAAGIAAALGLVCIDGDDLHSPACVAKMRAGSPLTTEDRLPWLDRIGERLRCRTEGFQGTVVSCSALRQSYRDRLRASAPQVRFVFLDGPAELIRERMLRREGHYMPPDLLDSQLATLERPGADEPDVTAVGIDSDLSTVVTRAVEAVRHSLPPHPDTERQGFRS